MNPIVMLCFNNLELSKKAVDSALAQDIPVDLVVVNNGSTDGTRQWLDDLEKFCDNVMVVHKDHNESPIKIGNEWLARLLGDAEYVLGMPNDVILPPNCYSEMLKWPRGFICASDHGKVMPETHPALAVSENTPMAVMLIRKWAWMALVAKDGFFFDENFFHYASDCDLALRMASCGIRGVQLDIPYWHYGSASVKLADPFTFERLRRGGDADRAYFERKWGFRVDSLEYGAIAQDPNFRG